LIQAQLIPKATNENPSIEEQLERSRGPVVLARVAPGHP
jgi:hypothetical protein